MPLNFLGLSVLSYDVRLGWNQQASSLTVGLVRDPDAGDVAVVPPLGTPVYFQHDGLRFAGLLQRFGESRDRSGAPVYQAVVVDPRDVLAGAQVVTAGFAGAAPVGNVLNAYGYWQATGFGGARVTGAGMPWNLVRQAVVAMANGGGAYGRPLEWAGVRYGLDLRDLPRVPDFYRVPAGTASLLELVGQVCEDAACDFFVELVGLTIRVRAATRVFAQGGLGFVRNLAAGAAFRDLAVGTEDAAEMTPEPTAVVVTGGAKTGVHVTQTFASYWGTDVDGRPVVGEPGELAPFGACEFANLNAADCADVVGSATYRCSTWEMRFALWGREAWDLFVGAHRPDVARLLGAVLHGGAQAAGAAFAPALPADGVNDAPENVALLADEQKADRQERLFDLVRRTAEEFYGKQYLATVPGVEAAYDAETGALVTSMEPVPAGYLRFGAAAVGVPPARLDVLQEPDERVVPFAYYADVGGADAAQLNLGDTAVDAAGRAWVRGQVSPRLLFLPSGAPAAHVRFGSAVFERRQDDFGDVTEVAKCYAPNVTAEQLAEMGRNQLGGSMGYVGLHPPAVAPTALGVPLRSNVETYGPWVVAGAVGAVRFEQDPSLTPWDYGSEAAMQAAGAARAAAGAGRAAVAAGGMTVVGGPAYSPGDLMDAAGPTLTDLNVSLGAGGLTTQYRWQSQFTPRFGLFGRQNADRLRRASLAGVEARRNLRTALNRAVAAAAVRERAFRGAAANRAFWERHQSPHTVFLAKAVAGSGALVRTAVGTEAYEAGLKLQQEAGHSGVAMMTVDGVLRGYTTDPLASGRLPRMTSPDGLGGLTAEDLNFVKAGNDIEVLAWGTGYAGAHAARRGNDPAQTRPLGLRGPPWVVGWGYSLKGQPVPGDGSGGFLANHLRRSDTWKAGPLDPLWDEWRGVWSVHDVLDGVTAGAVAAGATGVVNVGGNAARQITVRNRWSVAVPAGRHCHVSYIANRNEWQFSAVNCS